MLENAERRLLGSFIGLVGSLVGCTLSHQVSDAWRLPGRVMFERIAASIGRQLSRRNGCPEKIILLKCPIPD
jgi:hypothetical protein